MTKIYLTWVFQFSSKLAVLLTLQKMSTLGAFTIKSPRRSSPPRSVCFERQAPAAPAPGPPLTAQAARAGREWPRGQGAVVRRRGAQRRGAEQRVAGQHLVQRGAPGAEGRGASAVAAHALVGQCAAQRAPWGQVPVEGALRAQRAGGGRQGAGASGGPGALQVPAGVCGLGAATPACRPHARRRASAPAAAAKAFSWAVRDVSP